MRIAFIGLGTMGGRMAANVRKSGAELVVHDLHRQAAGNLINDGAVWAESPAAAARGADAVLMSLPGPPEVTAVCTGAGGVLEGLKPGTAVMDLSTNSPTAVRQIHAAFAAQGMHFLDCPVSGGPAGAASGKLAIWVGGDKAVFEANRAVLDRFADQVRYVGPTGAGSVAKLVHNCAGYILQTGLAEVFTRVSKAASIRSPCGRRCASAPRGGGALSTAWPNTSCPASSIRRPSPCVSPTRT